MNADNSAETEMNSDVQVTPCRGDRVATSCYGQISYLLNKVLKLWQSVWHRNKHMARVSLVGKCIHHSKHTL